MAAVWLKQYVTALIAPLTTAFANTQSLVQQQIANLTILTNTATAAANAATQEYSNIQGSVTNAVNTANSAEALAANAVQQNINSSGQQIFVGGIQIVVSNENGPTITSGTGVPTSSQPVSSIYYREDGGPLSTVYMSTGLGTGGVGTWTPLVDLAGLVALPNADPLTANQLWWDGSFLAKSSGP